MTQKSCAVGMRNAKLGNHLKPQAEGIKPEVTVFHFTDRPYANERVTQTQDKERCIKGQIYFELLY